MSALLLPALAAGSSGQGALYVDDVFSTYLRTGTGADTTVTTGIDMTKGYMLWSKGRSGATEHAVYDSARGVTLDLVTNSTAPQTTQATGLKAVSSTGHTIGSLAKMNTSGVTYVDWIFRKAPKFFDVVTYTGDGTNKRDLSHSLGVVPGFALIKKTSTSGDWYAIHSTNFSTPSSNSTRWGILNSTAAFFSPISTAFQSTATIPIGATAYSTGAGGYLDTNANGVQYVAYIFASDLSSEGIIRTHSFTTDASGNATVGYLGWEPQFCMFKSMSSSGDWIMLDVMRGWSMTANDPMLVANTFGAEVTTTEYGNPTATGFEFKGGLANTTYIYLAIRRQNKPPTAGTQVYNSSTASGVVSAGFPIDLHIGATRTGAASNHAMHARLTGGTRELVTSTTAAEATITDLGFDNMAGLKVSLPSGMVNHFLRRATGFFDVVCDTGTGSAHAVTHNLTKVPELVIRKSRSAATQWEVWHSALAATEKLVLNSNAAKATDAAAWNSTLPTATQFTVGTGANVNANAATFVTYLFATLAGISKVGSYTGNGSSQTIDCGFSTGARFVLIKRTNAAGDWYVWDTARGIVAANDPHLSLNTTAAEVTTDDSVDPASVGFIVNQNTATNINVNGGQYIFLAIA